MQVISNLDIGGAQEMVRTLAKGLREAGCPVVVCSFRDGPLRAEIEREGIPVEILPNRRNSALAFPLFLWEMGGLRRGLRLLVRKHDVNVVQTHLLRSMDFLVLSLQLGGGPRVLWTFHNALFDLREDHLARHKWSLEPKRFSHHLLYRLGSRWVSGLVAVSEDVKKSILETMRGIPAEKISVILNRVDTSRYGRAKDRSRIRQGLGFGPSDHLMAVVATLKRQKGHRFLLQAASSLLPRFPHLHLLLVGDGGLRADLQSLTRELKIESHVHFLGSRGDVPRILGASDSFVLPSLWEGLPMALMEAMASGLPIVATDVSGTRQVMAPGETGLIVPPADSSRLAQALAALLTDPERAAEMGRAARRRAETQLSVHKQVEEYMARYEHAAGGAGYSLVSTLRGTG